MPQRSTEFQKLVYLVRTHSAAGSTVTESKMLIDSKTGEEREVDIYIESNVDGIPVNISVECTETDRPAGSEWVERMKSKHEDLPTDVLVLVSRSGFYKPAIDKAKAYRKHVIALETLDENSAERLFGGAGILQFKTNALTATNVTIGLVAFGDLPTLQFTLPAGVYNGVLIFNQSGQVLSNVETLVHQYLHSPQTVYEFLRISQVHHKNFKMEIKFVRVGQGDPIYLRQEDQNPPVLRQIESLTISGDATVESSPVPLKHGKLEDTTVAWGTVPYEGKQALLVPNCISQRKNASSLAD